MKQDQYGRPIKRHWHPCQGNAYMGWCSIFEHQTNKHGELFHKNRVHAARHGLPEYIRYSKPGTVFTFERLEWNVANGWGVSNPQAEWMIVGGNTERLLIQHGSFSASLNDPNLRFFGSYAEVKPEPDKPSSKNIVHMMWQDYWWATNDGRWLKVSELSLGHALNILAYLIRNARQLHVAYVTSPVWNGAPDEVDAEIDRFAQMDTEQFIRDTPMYRALEARAIRSRVEEPVR